MPKPAKKPKISGIFGVSRAQESDISKSTLSRLATKNKLIRLDHGMYLHPDSKISKILLEERDYAQAYAKFGPDSVIGGLTALFHFGLLEQVPEQIWVIVPQTKQTRDSKYRLIRVKHLSLIGIEKHKFFRITNLERSLVETLKYSSKIGIRTVLTAIHRAVHEKQTTLEKLMDMAKKLGVENILKKHWETIIILLEIA